MDFKKVLIINPYGIGDVLFTTPVIYLAFDRLARRIDGGRRADAEADGVRP